MIVAGLAQPSTAQMGGGGGSIRVIHDPLV
jgi:hypothetical protein